MSKLPIQTINRKPLFLITDETHGGEDVGIFATGAGAYLVHGVMEENWIFYVMQDAMRLKK